MAAPGIAHLVRQDEPACGTHRSQVAAEALERHLGDPTDPSNPFSFARCVALDETESYPQPMCDRLEAWGLHHFYAPAAHGGRLRNYDEVLSVLRAVARRDLTVAIAHAKTFLGSVAVWVAGSEAQRRLLTERVRHGEQVALALTEPAHGADLLASDVRAERVPGGFRLSGEKWLVNNATRAGALAVFARTDERGGARGFTLFLVRKSELAGAYAHTPKIRTHGIRGADISGIRFTGCVLPDEAVIGTVGAGLEITVKSLQLTRTLCAGLSLGAADTALRLTIDFARRRRLYGDTVLAIPHARTVLADAFVDLLLCDAATATAMRAIHVTPEAMSVRAAVVKAFVPTASEAIVHDLSVVLGARHYLREGHHHGAFEKLVRDNRLVSLFDGSTVVNLSQLGLQLRQLARGRARERPGEAATRAARLEAVFSPGAPLPPFDPRRLDLLAHGRDDVVQGFEATLGRIARMDGPLASGAQAAILAHGRALLEELSADERRVEVLGAAAGGSGTPPAMFELARRYAAVHVAACGVHLWLHGRAELGEFFARGEWLAAALARILQRFRPELALERAPFTDGLVRELVRRTDERELFAVVPGRIA